jgi:hypothetical protein
MVDDSKLLKFFLYKRDTLPSLYNMTEIKEEKQVFISKEIIKESLQFFVNETTEMHEWVCIVSKRSLLASLF